jgi:hypothetical protein
LVEIGSLDQSSQDRRTIAALKRGAYKTTKTESKKPKGHHPGLDDGPETLSLLG